MRAQILQKNDNAKEKQKEAKSYKNYIEFPKEILVLKKLGVEDSDIDYLISIKEKL